MPLHSAMGSLGLVFASIFGGWLEDPQASATLAIALLGGGFALYRFRFVPRERKRETLEAMQKAYASSQKARASVLPVLPAYLAEGRKAVERAVSEAGVGRSDLKAELERWSDLTDTAAHEIIRSEVKFRSLLWAIGEIRSTLEQASGEDVTPGVPLPGEEAEALAASKRLVNQLNDFAQMVELGLFQQGDALGQFHRSIAAACKAVEPVIWHANVFGGRWGLRVLRMQLRAEHYNDAKEIHRASNLMWRRADGSAVIMRAALYRRSCCSRG